MMKYLYTKYGEVYSGYEWEDWIEFPEYRILIQGNKLQEFQKSTTPKKELEDIAKHGWVLGNDVVAKELDETSFRPQYSHNNVTEWWEGIYQRKYMFVFGAGASANCVGGIDSQEFESDNLRPPLGISLFGNRFKKYFENYKGVRQSLNFLQGEPNVESLLEDEWKSISKHNNQTVLSRHINIQYYIQEVLRDASNQVIEKYYAQNLYAKLFNKLQKKYVSSIKNSPYGEKSAMNFSIVSFNQDTILEHFACEQFNKEINSMNDYISTNEGAFSLFKPHGSWNWGWKFPDVSQFSNNTAKWLFDNNVNYYDLYYKLLGDPVGMVDWNRWGADSILNPHGLSKYTIDKNKLHIIKTESLNNYFPALLIPYRDKDEFTMPYRHFKKMEQYLSHIETIILIGWKGNEAAFNRLVLLKANRLKKVIIVDPNPDAVKQNLIEILAKYKIEPIIYNTFEEFAGSGVDKEIII